MPGKIELSGDVGGRTYRVEAEGAHILRIWARVTETFAQRTPRVYWVKVWPRGARCRPHAGRRLGPVLAEAEAALARLEAAATVAPAPPSPVSTPATSTLPWWVGRMTGSLRP
jgi:hypothetical protein